MQHSDLISMIRGTLDLKTDLIKALDFDKYNKHYDNDLSKEDIETVAKILEVSTDDIYLVESVISRYCYYKNGVYVELHLDPNNISTSENILNTYKKMINAQSKHFEDCINRKDFRSLFIYLDSKIRLSYFKEIIDIIPKEMRYEIFKDIYVSTDYSFGRLISEDFFNSLLEVKPKINKKDKESVLAKASIDSEGYITIYRGVGSKSTPLDKAFSWTTSLSVAIKFMVYAKRVDGDIYTAKVHIDDIIDFIDDRDEDEVLVKYKSLKEVKILDLIDIRELEDNLNCSYFMWRNYNFFKEEIQYIYENLDEIESNSKVYSYRILAISLILLDLLEYQCNEIDDTYRYILGIVATYLNIGNNKKSLPSKYGYKATKILVDTNIMNDFIDNSPDLSENIGLEEVNMIYLLLESIHLDYNEGKENILNSKDIKDKEKALLLYNTFKDAITLYKFKDNNLKLYDLNFKVSEKLLKIAEQVKIFKDFE